MARILLTRADSRDGCLTLSAQSVKLEKALITNKTNNVRCLRAAVGMLCGVAALAAEAVTLDFQCVTFNAPANCALGESLLSVDVTEYGAGQVLFRFDMAPLGVNEAPNVSQVYFDNGAPGSGALLSIATLIDVDDGPADMSHAGVDFSLGASPPNLPGGNTLSPAFVVTPGFLAGADTPKPQERAIDQGEWLGVVFNLQAGYGFADVLAELAGGELRIGVHMTSFADGGSESLVTTPTAVPVPAALWLFGSGLVGLTMVGRRRSA